jgi:hypothetical protein
MIKLYQFKPAETTPNPGPFWLGEKAFFRELARPRWMRSLILSCQYRRAFAEISVERSWNDALKLVSLL